MKNYTYEELNNKSIDELEIIKNEAYDNFVETLSKLPLDVREAFNYYMNLARNIEIIINERNKKEKNELKVKI